MALGHKILFILVCVATASACSRQGWVSRLPETEVRAVAAEVSAEDWDDVLKLTKRSSDPLLHLVRDYAHYRSNNFEEVLKSENLSAGPFVSYQIYLKSLSANQLKDYKSVLALPTPDDLPRRLEFRIALSRAQAQKELGNLDAARSSLLKLLAQAGRSGSRAEILMLLADVEWSMDLKSDALKRYRTLYESFPLASRDDETVERLSESGEYDSIETDTHLQRIQRIQRAAQFQRANRELQRLLKQTPPDQREPIQLAEAQLAFAMREYTRSSLIAAKAIKTSTKPDLKAEWQNLYAWSLIRLGKSDEGREVYEKLLQSPIPERLRESLLFRMGASAIDDDKYQMAIPYFRELRERYGRGRFVESAHWFEAWALFQNGSQMKPTDRAGLEQANDLLNKLPRLPDGAGLEAQSLYWRARTLRALDQLDEALQIERELNRTWELSFYSLLLRKNPFQFLRHRINATDLKPTRQSIEAAEQFEGRLSWERLEAFRSVHLMEWAQLEMAVFLDEIKSRDRGYRMAVANRLQAIEDWADLVKWTEANIGKSLESLHEDPEVLEFLYPRAHEAAVLEASAEFRVSPYLIWGLMREESRFEADVRSHAGAEGLMQLMPSLSRRIGKVLKEPRSRAGWMFDPKRNIRFGTFHLRELINEVNAIPVSDDLKMVLVVAAYNAGIDPVRRWVKEQDTENIDVFVESIPYTETRGYVKRVLQSASIYSKIWGRK